MMRQWFSNKRLDQSGFTLVEITISMALLSATLVVATISYSAIAALQQRGAAARNTQQNARYALESMERDIRNSASLSFPSSSSISLTNSLENGGSTTYALGNGAGDAGNTDLIRTVCITSPSGGQTCTPSVVSGTGVRVTQLTIMPPPATAAIPFVKITMQVQQKSGGLSVFDPYASTYTLSTTVSMRYFQ